MKRKKIYLIKFLSLVFLYPLFAAGNLYPEVSPLSDRYYIGEEPGADVIGRGGAIAGAEGGPFSPYWNPAGLAFVSDNCMGVSLNVLSDSELETSVIKKLYALEDRKLNFISVAAPEVAAYWRMLSDRVDEFSFTDGGVPVNGAIEKRINQFGVSVAVEQSDITYFGMNINYMSGIIGYSEIRGSTPTALISGGQGWGLDWGIIFDVTPQLNIGVSLLNGPAYMYWDKYDTYSLPLVFRCGIDINMTNLMTLGIDYENGLYDDTVDDSDILRLGIEHYLTSEIILRGGIYGADLNDRYRSVYTAGLGYKKNNYSLDLAAIQYYAENETVRRFTVSGIVSF